MKIYCDEENPIMLVTGLFVSLISSSDVFAHKRCTGERCEEKLPKAAEGSECTGECDLMPWSTSRHPQNRSWRLGGCSEATTFALPCISDERTRTVEADTSQA